MFSWFTHRPTPAPAPAAGPACAAPPLPNPPVPPTVVPPEVAESYPPVDRGIGRRDAEAILHANADLLARIKLAYGCDEARFERDILRLLRRHADYINVLPATADNYFHDPGGLFRMCLEIGFYALQATDSQIFVGRATITGRLQLEPRWRLATFMAGLCGELHRTLSQVTVRDRKGNEWPHYLCGLTTWLQTRGEARFFLRWSARPQEIRATGVFLLPHVVDQTMLQYLAEGNAVVVPHMMASISGMATYHEHNTLDALVRRATALVIDQNLQASADRYGRPTLGAHLERYLVDAMRRLAAGDAAWQANARRSRLWYGSDGVYLVWPGALADVAKLLESEHLPGIPRSPDTMLEVLIESGVAQPRDAARASWVIYPPGADQPLEAVLLASPAVVFGTMIEAPEPLALALREGPASAAQRDTTGNGRHAPSPPIARLAPGELAAALGERANGHARGPVAANGPAPAQAIDQASGPASEEAIGQAIALDGADAWPEGAAVSRPQSTAGLFDAAADIAATGAGAAAAVPGRSDAPDRSRAPGPPPVVLQAPPGLPAMVGEPVRQIVAQLCAPGQSCCRTVPGGLFIPLTELARRGLDPGIATRALARCGMLVGGEVGTGYEQIHEFQNQMVNGLVIAPDYVGGLDLALFQRRPRGG